ncbi:MAG: hypothetical protein HKN37_02640 [Rhodothermales bacterium]|nr:hypothetical protein [Rhodothermales bacterium]
MFISLLIVTFLVAIVVSFLVARLFSNPIHSILARIVIEDISSAWQRYIMFAIYVVGIAGGVRVHQLERYIVSNAPDQEPLLLTGERWTLEIYRTIIETLSSIAWMLLVFFVFALIAFVVVRGFELKHGKKEVSGTDSS